MKNVYFAFLFLSLSGCKAQDASSAKMKPDAFEKAIQTENIQILDVRTASEYNSGHIENSLQADWNNQPQFLDRIQYIDKIKPVYIYCLAGGRSNAAANWMRSNGFKNVIELEGGINAWKASNMPVEGSSSEPQMTMEQYTTSIPKDKIVLIDFGAVWCPPCVQMAPVIADLEKTNTVIKIDAGLHTNLMKAMNIEAIPVFIIYKNGKEVWRKQGITTKDELVAHLN
jgi:rhodanese-related sulfurtransferase/thiol-disulfide isomerase/thioredoxin